MSPPEVGSTLDVSRASTSSSSDQVKTMITNLSYPTRPTLYAPWACPPKPLVIRPTVYDRYETTFVYSNGSAGLAVHNVQTSNSSLDIFDYDVLKWIKSLVSRHVSRLGRKFRLAKAKISVPPLLRRRNQNV